MSVNEKLIAVQSKLKAPKNQTNDFGKYKYRSCEDILEAVKPLLKEHGLSLVVSDEIFCVNEKRVYVKATATVNDGEISVSATAYAREPEIKKGMDESQITGAASSYARKFALNGLFAIDDTADADTEKPTKEEFPKPNKKEAAVIKAVYEKLFDSTPEGKVLSEEKIGKAIYACKGAYVDDIKKVGVITEYLLKGIASLCE